ncbi:hypothetical protein QQX98_001267 [Neonectria punicea]|uniref:Uncharacterized protein n=1 Tax=Neonectria punicea TaxID=979145 RepID=A0ABR1HPQ3_9HYPO
MKTIQFTVINKGIDNGHAWVFQRVEQVNAEPLAYVDIQGLNYSFKSYPIRTANPVHKPSISKANRLATFHAFNSHAVGGTISKDHESWHSRDVIPPSDVLDVVDVDLGESEMAV